MERLVVTVIHRLSELVANQLKTHLDVQKVSKGINAFRNA